METGRPTATPLLDPAFSRAANQTLACLATSVLLGGEPLGLNFGHVIFHKLTGDRAWGKAIGPDLRDRRHLGGSAAQERLAETFQLFRLDRPHLNLELSLIHI